MKPKDAPRRPVILPPRSLAVKEVHAEEAITDPIVIAPLRGTATAQRPWEGTRPWEGRKVTAIIPTLEWSTLLALAVESLLLQTEPPLVMIVDTGSVRTTDKLQAMRRRNQIEVISIPLQGWIHPSEPVASAIEAAWVCIHTPYAYLTHDDCIAKRRELIAEMVDQTATHKAVGYRITERPYPEWRTELGHTCLMLDVAAMDRIGMSWNLRAFATVTGESLNPEVCGPNKVDTERFMNFKLRQAGIVPLFIGEELNYERTNDANIDHCRSRTSSLLYSPPHAAKSKLWTVDAIHEATLRHTEWMASPTP